jgi:hypothetical protein
VLKKVQFGPAQLLSDTLVTCFEICEATLKGNFQHYTKQSICHTRLDIATNSAVEDIGVGAVLPTSYYACSVHTVTAVLWLPCRLDG